MSKVGRLTTEPTNGPMPVFKPETRCSLMPRGDHGRSGISDLGVSPPHARQLWESRGAVPPHDSNNNLSRVPVTSTADQLRTTTRNEFYESNLQTPPGSAPAVPVPPSLGGPPVTPTVSAITLVTGPAGATTGYPAIMGNSNLNVPGPFNHAPTGEVTNVHQIRFRFDQGTSAAVSAVRIVRATFTEGGTQARFPADLPGDPGGIGGTRTHSDGPPPHEIQRPDANTLVVADAPGMRALSASQYPFSLAADFTLSLVAGTTDIARINYEVRITKTSATDIPNTQNSVTATDKADLVRGRSLR